MLKDIRIETRTSKKTGIQYEVLILVFVNGYEKAVLCDTSELFMIKQIIENNRNNK